MKAGVLNEIIEIQEPIIIKNEYGEEMTENYSTKLKTRAEVSYNSGNKTADNNEIFFSYDITFTIRYYHNVSELDRVIWLNKPYKILSMERNRKFQLINLRCSMINE